MLTNLRIKNFRMLEDLEIPKLGRVNLIVGKNNSGKSSILEALRIYAGDANLELLSTILNEHDESYSLDRTSFDGSIKNWLGLKNLFPNRKFPSKDNINIALSSNEKTLLKIEYIFYYFKDESDIDEDGQPFSTRRRVIVKSDLSNIEDSALLYPAIRITLESGKNTIHELEEIKTQFSTFWLLNSKLYSFGLSYVPSDFLSSEQLSTLWDEITLSPYENIVIKALKLIDDRIEKLAFIESHQNNNSRFAIVKTKDVENRIPLNSMGDGMSRILQLILSVFPAKDGILLIDEFENGLHYSVQEEVWRIIFQLAKELNIQVFATTHSWDCIESFTKAAVESPKDGILLKVSRSKLTSDHGKVIATVYDEAELQTITASELEIR
ncbi:AAA family ATPase [Methylomonas montana]|uniref:AAA family ATPase n=1 Tax=Methylomonas montana TaxID=3058963 RepID=UPI00265B4EB1|nr:ATP-binding protein [Methylomonas montana]WKJ89323.1 AAA family ATPase [Methylomonas montana]